jgi:gas vesicle protein
MGESTGKAVLGFLVGAAAGAALGVLFAPDKGTKTRKRIARQADDISSSVKDSVNENIEDLKEYVTTMVDDVKKQYSRIEKDVKDNSEKIKSKAKAAAS